MSHDELPDFTFWKPDGSSVRLSALCTAEYLLLVFLRHLA